MLATENLTQAREELMILHNQLQVVTEPELVDSIIWKMKAAESQLEVLKKEAKSEYEIKNPVFLDKPKRGFFSGLIQVFM